MRTPLLPAVLALLIIEALLVPRTVSNFRAMRQSRLQAASEAMLPTSIGPFAGYDAEGLPLTLLSKDTKWIVPIVLHSAQLPSDLDYVNSLKDAIAGREITILGICDQGPCGDARPPGHAAPGFPVVAYGSYVPLMEIAHYDDLGQVMLLNEHWALKRTLHRQASAKDLASEIQKVLEK